MTIGQLYYSQDKHTLLPDIGSVQHLRVGYSACSHNSSDKMSKDNLDEYQPLLVKDFTDRKQSKVCELWSQNESDATSDSDCV